MKNKIAIPLFALVVAMLTGVTVNAQTSINNLSWLTGCWAGSAGGREFTEHWTKPGGGTMLGLGRTIAKGKTVSFEFLQIRQQESGEIVYIAKPSGQTETTFKLVSASAMEVTFENPTHDFPQRITYRLDDQGSLLASTEGMVKGKKRTIGFPMKRERCE